MKKAWFFAFCIFVSIGLTACQGSSGLKPEDLYGVWKQDGVTLYFILEEGANFKISQTSSGTAPLQFGMFTLDGNSITITDDDGSPCSGFSDTWEIEVIDKDSMVYTPVDIHCPEWEGISGDFLFTRYSE